MFFKIATVQILSVYQDEGLDLSNWRNFLNKENNFLENKIFKYDPENFLYFRTRMISAGEKWGPNQNGDYFPAKELSKAYKTFIGKGFYLEHDSDTPEKAKGIILDSIWYPDHQYVEGLVAQDKRLFPEVAEQIKSGVLNTVSMGCVVSKCVCSICGNEATNQYELCEHMNPESPFFVKGKEVNGQKAFEYNYGLNFVELSGVRNPADTNAFIFEVKGSKKPLFEHFLKYQEAKDEEENKAKIDVDKLNAAKIDEIKGYLEYKELAKIDDDFEELANDELKHLKVIKEKLGEDISDESIKKDIENVSNLENQEDDEVKDKVEDLEEKQKDENVEQHKEEMPELEASDIEIEDLLLKDAGQFYEVFKNGIPLGIYVEKIAFNTKDELKEILSHKFGLLRSEDSTENINENIITLKGNNYEILEQGEDYFLVRNIENDCEEIINKEEIS